MPQKPQTAPLPLSGVREQQQIPGAAPAPAAPAFQPPPVDPRVQIQQQPFDQAAAQNVAIARDQALKQQAEGAYPENNPASLLSTLAGIAGNIAGAITHKGDVGSAAVQYGDQLRQDAATKQRQFMARVTEEEQRYKQQQKELTDLQNKQLRANSLVPVINGLKVAPEARAAIFTQLAAGDVDGADSAIRHAEQMVRQREQDALNATLKNQASEISLLNAQIRSERWEKDKQLKDINYLQKLQDYTQKPAREQQKIVDKESKDYNSSIQKIKGPLQDFTTIMQMIGDPESPEAKAKLNRIMGATGAARGQYLGTPEDKQLYQALLRLHGTMKTEDFGSSLTNNEQAILKSFTGIDLSGKLLGNLGRNADNVLAGLQGVQRILEGKLDAAGAGKLPATLQAFEKGGNPLTLRAFTQAVQDAKAIGGKNLDATPPGVDPDVWMKLNGAQRREFYKQISGASNAQ